MKKTHRDNRKLGIFQSTFVGLVVSFGISLILISLSAWGIVCGRIPEEMGQTAIYCVFFLSVLLGTMTATKYQEKNHLISNYIIASLYLFTLVCLNVVFAEGNFDRLWVNLLLAVAGASLPTFRLQRRKMAHFKHRHLTFVQH